MVEIDWLGYTALAVANGVSATDITLIFDHEHDFDIGQRRTIPTDWALGGCIDDPPEAPAANAPLLDER